MGILREKVKEAFREYKKGNLEQFVLLIAEVSDVGWEWHKRIVIDEIRIQLKLLEQIDEGCMIDELDEGFMRGVINTPTP